jgi:mRNA-degrading endonuclease RelE of RelBE toxin-antitoxin system
LAYQIEVSPLAAEELAALRAFDQRAVVEAIRRLVHEAETATRNRKQLREPVGELPDGTWQIRVGSHRVFYEVVESRIARILRVIIKQRTTAESL